MGIAKFGKYMCDKIVSAGLADLLQGTLQYLGHVCIVDLNMYVRDYIDSETGTADYQAFQTFLTGLSSNFFKVYLISDGFACLAKFPEQLFRRLSQKKLYARLGLKYSSFFEPDNQLYLDIIKQFYTLTLDYANIEIVSSPTKPAEADHKIFKWLRANLYSLRRPVVLLTADWDFVPRWQCLAISRQKYCEVHSESYFMNKKFSYKFDLGLDLIDNLKFIQNLMIFGCDYYPGLGNFSFCPEYLSLLEQYTDIRFLKWTGGRFKIKYKQLIEWLQDSIPMFHQLDEYNQQKWQVDLEKQKQLQELHDAWLQSETEFKKDRVKVRSYMTLLNDTFLESEICDGLCDLCDPDMPYDEIMCRNFLDIYIWTINHYGIGLHSPIIYKFSKAPRPEHLLKFLQNAESLILEYPSATTASRQTFEKFQNTDIKYFKVCPKRPIRFRSENKGLFIDIK